MNSTAPPRPLSTASSPPSDLLVTEVLDFFVAAGRLLGQPKSVAEVYGTLYFSEEPLCMSEIITRLNMSKGSASQGLRLLRDMGAVRVVAKSDDRRDFFEAETSLKKMVRGYFQSAIDPHLSNGDNRVKRMKTMAKTTEASEFHLDRIDQLGRWQKNAALALPVLRRLFK